MYLEESCGDMNGHSVYVHATVSRIESFFPPSARLNIGRMTEHTLRTSAVQPQALQQTLQHVHPHTLYTPYGWLRGTVVERRSVTGELFLSYARPATDG